MVSPRCGAAHAALVVFLSSSTCALGALTGVTSQSSLSAFSSLEREGVMDAGTDFLEFFPLHVIGSMDEERMSTAALATADAESFASATSSFEARRNQLSLSLDLAARGEFDVRGSDTFALSRSRAANLTRFTTDRAVRLTLSFEAMFSFDLNFLTTPVLPQTVVALLNEDTSVEDPVFAFEQFEGKFNQYVVDIGPGTYQLRTAVDDTIQSFGFPEGFYEAQSALTLNARITRIPGAGTGVGVAALFGLGAARRRR